MKEDEGKERVGADALISANRGYRAKTKMDDGDKEGRKGGGKDEGEWNSHRGGSVEEDVHALGDADAVGAAEHAEHDEGRGGAAAGVG